MKKILLMFVLFISIQNISVSREITFKDRISHPIATVIHSFSWLSDPFYLIYCFGIGNSPRVEDDDRYKKYITGESSKY